MKNNFKFSQPPKGKQLIKVVKRESWKGKYFVVARERGKIISKTKWTKQTPIIKLRNIYSKNRSFKQSEKRIFLATKVEHIKTINKKSKRPSKPYQVAATIYYKGKTYSARSQKSTKSLNKARQEALNNLEYLISPTYDKNEGRRILKNKTVKYQSVAYNKI